MSNDIDRLIKFYENEGKEELRLHKNSVQHLEFLTASKYLDTHLAPGSKILDSCAGTGIYSFYLAQAGHQVCACDIVPYNVEIINKKQSINHALQQVLCADAQNMSMLADNSFDAVLCMGALYHLQESTARQQVVGESIRLLKPGGLFVGTYMNRHAVILHNLSSSIDNINEIMAFLENGREAIFYASTPEESMTLLNEAGLQIICHVALDGMSAFLRQVSGHINDEGLGRFHQYHFASCEQPSLLGYSYHNMLIARLPQ